MYGITRSPWIRSARRAARARLGRGGRHARVPMAEGSDGGGSIRIPAANCGLVDQGRGRISLAPALADF
jgi:amidase